MDKREFCKFEKEKNLFERTYHGTPYWQKLRFMVCEGVASDRIEKENQVHKISRSRKKFGFILRALLLAVKNELCFSRIPSCDAVCFVDNNKKNSTSRFFDYWEMPREIRTICVKETIDPEMLCLKDQYTLIAPYVKARVKYAVAKLLRREKADETEVAFLRELEKELRSQFGRSISAELMEREIRRWRFYDKEYEYFAEKFFDKVQCKAIVVVQYYQDQLYAFYRVARKKGIKVIELQHGVISNHEEYWFEDKRGINNYTPDYFLCFGKQHIDRTKLLPTTKAFPVGFPYQEAQLDMLGPIATEDKTIVVYPYSDPAFEAVIRDFAVAAVPKGYRVIVKLHPGEATDPRVFYPVLTNTQEVELITDQSKGIYYWLKRGKFHVMADTTVGLEALSLPHTVVCIAEHVPHVQMQPLLDWSVAEGFTTAQQLMQIVESPREKMEDTIKSKREALWQPNAKENMQRFFSEFAAGKI